MGRGSMGVAGPVSRPADRLGLTPIEGGVTVATLAAPGSRTGTESAVTQNPF